MMSRKFVVPNIFPAPSDPHAVALDHSGMLGNYLSGARRPIPGIAEDRQSRFPAFMLANVLLCKALSLYRYECARFALSPLFEQWVMRRFSYGDHLITGLGYMNRLIPRVREAGGKVFLDARNSHPSNFWSIVAEEHARWDVSLPPIWPRHHLRQQRSIALADYVLAPSRFVADSFIARGFPGDRLFKLPYPVDLSLFKPSPHPRPAGKPLTLVSSGLLTLRKGSPYLFEALGILRREIPDIRIKLIDEMADGFRRVYERNGYSKLPVEWSPMMPREKLVPWLWDADIFVLPTLEEGMVRSAAEALACGLPVITTRNAGVDEFIEPGVNGTIIPIRDPDAIANAVIEWWEKIREGTYDHREGTLNPETLGHDSFARNLLEILRRVFDNPDQPLWTIPGGIITTDHAKRSIL